MAGSKYQLLMQAKLDGSKSLDKDLMKKIRAFLGSIKL